jgi:hypothetical protein
MIAAGWSMGSQAACQRLVELVIRSVRKPDERMGSVQRQGVARGVTLEPTPNHMRAGVRSGEPRLLTRPERDPLPPPPYRCAVGGLPQFFLQFS